jgi:Asp-tRNA(Asn)/Glu-tRNA(Gln) amidotransferase A subunit family amidase
MTHLERAFTKCDVVAAPACGGVAPVIALDALAHGETDLRATGELMRFTVPVNMGGLPAAVVPVGTGEAGMPVGLQLVGRPWDEATVTAVGTALEDEVGGGAVRGAALGVDLLGRVTKK